MTGGTVRLLLALASATFLLAPLASAETASYRSPPAPPAAPCSVGTLYVDCTPLAAYANEVAASATKTRFTFYGPYYGSSANVYVYDAVWALLREGPVGLTSSPSFKVYSSSGFSNVCIVSCSVYVPPGGALTVSIDPLDWSPNEVQQHLNVYGALYWPISGTIYVDFS